LLKFAAFQNSELPVSVLAKGEPIDKNLIAVQDLVQQMTDDEDKCFTIEKILEKDSKKENPLQEKAKFVFHLITHFLNLFYNRM
jgi:hypothetical protein